MSDWTARAHAVAKQEQALSRDWQAAYQQAFVNAALARNGWTREDAETAAHQLSEQAYLGAWCEEWDCVKIAEADVALCEEAAFYEAQDSGAERT